MDEIFFRKSPIRRPHPYTDCPSIDFDNKDEMIPVVTIEELLNIMKSIRTKRNRVMHIGFQVICFSFLILITGLFFYLYLILFAKKDSVCSPCFTRPISLIDCFQNFTFSFCSFFRDEFSLIVNLISENDFVFKPEFFYFMKMFIT